MPYSKNYAKSSDKTVYPKWIEVSLTAEEEREAENLCREKNIGVMKECIADAREIVRGEKLFETQTHIVRIATSLFEKRASHEVFFKESKTKEKFDKQQD